MAQETLAEGSCRFCWALLWSDEWPEVVELSSTTSERTINTLRSLVAAYGLPKQLVTDNGPQFTSTEFGKFAQQNGIKHIFTAPYHPSSNGAVECFVQTFKQAMKAGERSELSVQHGLQSFLLSYQSTPQTTTGHTPAELFLKRTLLSMICGDQMWEPGCVHSKQTKRKVMIPMHEIVNLRLALEY